MRVILALDREELRADFRRMAESVAPDIQVFEAGSATGLLRGLVEHHPVGVAVVDPALPGLEGGLAAISRRFPETRWLMVAVGEGMDAARVRGLGGHGLLPPDPTAEDLVAALRIVMAGGWVQPPAGRRAGERPHGACGPGLDPSIRLTPRQRDIAALLTEGLPNKVIANRLSVSEVTVKSHLGKVFRKLGVRNRLQAMRKMAGASPC